MEFLARKGEGERKTKHGVKTKGMNEANLINGGRKGER